MVSACVGVRRPEAVRTCLRKRGISTKGAAGTVRDCFGVRAAKKLVEAEGDIWEVSGGGCLFRSFLRRSNWRKRKEVMLT